MPGLPYDIVFYDDTTGYFVGDSEIWRTSNGGQGWARELLIENPNRVLSSASILRDGTGVAVGEGGVVYWNGSRNGGSADGWHIMSTHIGHWLNDLSFPCPQVGFCVGDMRSILKTTNGGVNWTQQSASVPAFYNGVWAENSTHATIVGDSA